MATETDIGNSLQPLNGDRRAAGAALGVLALLQILLLSVYMEFTSGYFIVSIMLGGAGYFLLSAISRI
jgi:hypothetical protein